MSRKRFVNVRDDYNDFIKALLLNDLKAMNQCHSLKLPVALQTIYLIRTRFRSAADATVLRRQNTAHKCRRLSMVRIKIYGLQRHEKLK